MFYLWNHKHYHPLLLDLLGHLDPLDPVDHLDPLDLVGHLDPLDLLDHLYHLQ